MDEIKEWNEKEWRSEADGIDLRIKKAKAQMKRENRKRKRWKNLNSKK
jgi:hypothetical protein